MWKGLTVSLLDNPSSFSQTTVGYLLWLLHALFLSTHEWIYAYSIWMTRCGPLSFPRIEFTRAPLLNSCLTDGSLGWSHKEGATCNLLLFTKHPFWFATNWSKKLIWCWDLLSLFLSIKSEAWALSRVWIVVHFVFAKAVTHNVLPPNWERPSYCAPRRSLGCRYTWLPSDIKVS